MTLFTGEYSSQGDPIYQARVIHGGAEVHKYVASIIDSTTFSTYSQLAFSTAVDTVERADSFVMLRNAP